MIKSSEQKVSHENIISFLESLFSRRGGQWYMGEPVTMAQHMLQAAYFAEKAGADDELIIAALLHDIGHFTSDFPEDCLAKGEDNFHEDDAAEFLTPFFSARVIDPIRLHVACKRYLCATNPKYYDVLSQASIQSLEVQGGAMNADEVVAFEKLPNYQDAVRVRHFDEAGKQAQLDVPDFSYYKDKLKRCLTEA